MLLIIAFALFVLLIAAWIAMPGASTAQGRETPVSAAMPEVRTHAA